MPKRRPAASSTRMPSGTTSLPMPSPGMTAIRYLLTPRLPPEIRRDHRGSAPARQAREPSPTISRGLLATRRLPTQHRRLAGLAPGVVAQVAVGEDRAMARHDEADRVAADGGAHRSRCARIPDRTGQIAVRDQGARRYPQQ